MADIFISYKSERRAAAEHLAEILADHGYSVWWDYGLVSGQDFGSQIETELRAAKAVVVLWCTRSRDSEWVKEEAGMAKRLGTLLPVTIEPVELPLGFSMAQTIDLSLWDGAPASSALSHFLRDVSILVRRPPLPNPEGLERSERSWRRFGAPSLAQFPLVDALERQRPARTLPSAVGQSNAQPFGSQKAGPAAAPQIRAALPRWLPIAGGALACLLAGGLAVTLLAPPGDGPKAAAPQASSAGPPRTTPSVPQPDPNFVTERRREAAVKPECAAAGQKWDAIRPTATLRSIRAFQFEIPASCLALYVEAGNVRGKIVRIRDATDLPAYSDCTMVRRDWAVLGSDADPGDLSRLLRATPYELDGCRDTREAIRKASMQALNRDMDEFDRLKIRFQ